MSKDYQFLVLNGVGVTVFGNEEIHLHLPQTIDLRGTFNKSVRVFPGRICQSNLPLRAFNLKVGQSVRVFDFPNYSYSLPLNVDGIFSTSHISEKVSPLEIATRLDDPNFPEIIHEFSKPGEIRYYGEIIQSVLKQAVVDNSWTVSHAKVLAGTTFKTGPNMAMWLEDLVAAGLLTIDSKTKISVCSSLIYMTMHSINRRKVMSGPIFSY
jgi:hypothetical protein